LMPIDKSRAQHYVFMRGMIYYAHFEHGRDWFESRADGNWRPRCYRRSSFGAFGVTSALSKDFQKCAFRNSIWRIVPSIIVIFIHQMASCLHRQLAKCKFPIANCE
jgi:hypothetical protein